MVGILIFAAMGTNGNNSNTTLNSDNPLGTEKVENGTAENKKIYAVGEVFENSNIAIKYVSNNADFKGYGQYSTIKDGCKILSAEFEFENVGASDRYVSAYEFNCYADGYDCESFFSVENSGFSSTLSAGKKTKGTVYFQVPANAGDITIEYKLNMFNGDKVEFVVK